MKQILNEKLVVTELIKKITVFYGTRRLLPAFGRFQTLNVNLFFALEFHKVNGKIVPALN
jgi:hypothetical protein